MKMQRSLRRFLVSSSVAWIVLAVGVCWADDPPSISGVRNRAGGSTAVAGDLVDIIGSNLADSGLDPASGWPVPLSSGTTTVSSGPYSVPILWAAPDHIRIQVPWELAGLTSIPVSVKRNGASGTFTLTLNAYAPQVVGVSSPAISAGAVITLSAIGLGSRIANPVTGAEPSSESAGAVETLLRISIGGVAVPVLKTQLADSGDPQVDVGVESISVRIPANVPAGAVSLVISEAGVASDPFPLNMSPPDVQISIDGPSGPLPLGSSFTFKASVQGSPDTVVTWSVDSGGYSTLGYNPGPGSISRDGIFNAPFNMPAPSWGIVRATHSSGAFAAFLVTFAAQNTNTYRIVPENPVLIPGQSVSFSVLDSSGAPVSNISWSIYDDVANISSDTYTAPATGIPPTLALVRARIPGSDVASTVIFIDPPRTPVSGTSPQVGHVGENLTILNSYFAQFMRVRLPMADGSFSSATPTRTDGGLMITVPHGAVSGSAWLEMSNIGASTFLSPPFSVTILPRLRLRSTRLRVSSGESVAVIAAAPDVPASYNLTWSADAGSVDAQGIFTAPAVMGLRYVRVWACLLQSTECGTTIIEVLPYRLATDPFILNPGEKAKLQAFLGAGNISAQWTALTGNVTVLPDGTITAGVGLFDSGSATVRANFAGIVQTFEISIRGSGAVAYTAEYLDWTGNDPYSLTGRLALGLFGGPVATNGDWVYTLSRSLPSWDSGPWLSNWLDVYRLDERRNPIWITSLEAPYGGGSLVTEPNTLYVVGQEGPNNVCISYDITNGNPVLTGRRYFDGKPSTYRRQGLGFGFTPSAGYVSDPPGKITITDYASGTIRSLDVDFQPLQPGAGGTIVGAPGWAAITYSYGISWETVVFDTTGPVAEPLADVPSGGFNDSSVALQDVLVVGGDVYQIVGNSVNLVSQIPTHWILDSDPSTKRLLGELNAFGQGEGIHVVDLSDPANPKLSAAAEFPEFNVSGALGTDYFALGNGAQAVSIYPIVWSGGVRAVDTFQASTGMYALATQGNYLYWTGPGTGAPGTGRVVTSDFFEVVDLSVSPATVVAAVSRPGNKVGYSVAANGRYIYVGTSEELLVYDVGIPAAPVMVMTIPEPAISMTLQGNFLYAGGLTANAGKLVVFDVSNPAVPREIGSQPVANVVWGIAAQAGWLAVALGKSGYQIFSLANPAAPASLFQSNVPAWDVKGSGTLLYVASDFAGLTVMSLAQLANPVLVGQFPLSLGNELSGESPRALAVTLDPRGIAWVVGSTGGRVYGIDIRQPYPRLAAEIGFAYLVFDVQSATAVFNNELIIAGNSNVGLDTGGTFNMGLFRISNQTSPGSIQPDRYNQPPPLANTRSANTVHATPRIESLKTKPGSKTN